MLNDFRCLNFLVSESCCSEGETRDVSVPVLELFPNHVQRQAQEQIFRDAVGVLQCLWADKSEGEAKISHLPSAEISEEGILWEKGKAVPKHTYVLQNQGSNWESLLGLKRCPGAAIL